MAVLDKLLLRLTNVNVGGVPVPVPQPTATQSSPTPPTAINFVSGAAVAYNAATSAYDVTVTAASTAGQYNTTLGNGLNSNVPTNGQPTLRLGGPTGAFSVGGFLLPGGATPAAGQQLAIVNTTTQPMTVVNEDASSAAVARITTQAGGPVVLQPKAGSITLVYDGTTSRWLLQNIGAQRPSVVNVLDYGADATGAADSTTPFVNAIAACAAVGGRVYVPTGTYKLTAALAVPVGVSMRGDGMTLSKLYWTSATDGLDLISPTIFQGSTLSGQTIEDLFIQSSGSGLDAISIQYRNQVRVHNCQISVWTGRAMFFSSCIMSRARDNLISLCGSAPVATNITGATNASPTVIHAVAHGLADQSNVSNVGIGGNTKANGNYLATLVDVDHYSIPIDTSAGSAYTSGGTAQGMGYSPIEVINYCVGLRIEDTYMTECQSGGTPCQSGVRIDQSTMIRLTGGAVETAGVAVQICAIPTTTAFDAASITIDGVDFEGPTDHYIDVGLGMMGGGTAVANVRVNNNNMTNSATAQVPYGVKLANCARITIDGNVIGQPTSGYVSTIDNGPNVSGVYTGLNSTSSAAGRPYVTTSSYLGGPSTAVANASPGMPWVQGIQTIGNVSSMPAPSGSTISPSVQSFATQPTGYFYTSAGTTANVNVITGAASGQRLLIQGNDGGNTTLVNAAGGTGQMHFIGGSSLTLANGEVVELVFNPNATDWYQVKGT